VMNLVAVKHGREAQKVDHYTKNVTILHFSLILSKDSSSSRTYSVLK
jgi:hypothetical protein